MTRQMNDADLESVRGGCGGLLVASERRGQITAVHPDVAGDDGGIQQNGDS